MWTELDHANAAGFAESEAEDHFDGGHEGNFRACCHLCVEEAGE